MYATGLIVNFLVSNHIRNKRLNHFMKLELQKEKKLYNQYNPHMMLMGFQIKCHGYGVCIL